MQAVRLMTADPGLSGAIAFCEVFKHDHGYDVANVRVHKMPTTFAIDGKELPCPVAILDMISREGAVDAAMVEQVGPMPGNGRAGQFRFAMGFGILLSCISRSVPKDSLYLSPPSSWKKKMNVTSDKGGCVALANSLASGDVVFSRGQHDQAEAYLLAHYYARHVL